MNPINLIARKYNIPQDLEIYVMQDCILPSTEIAAYYKDMVCRQIKNINWDRHYYSFKNWAFICIKNIKKWKREESK